MKKNMLAGIVLCLFISCNAFNLKEGSMLLSMHTDAGGQTIREGELVELTAIEKTEEDSVIWNSADEGGTALVTRMPSVFNGDLFTALGKLSKGDSATVRISLDSMVEKMNYKKPANTKGKYIVYTLAVVNVIAKNDMPDSVYKVTTDRFLKQRLEQAKNKEGDRIAAYIAARHLTTTVQPSGLQYVVTGAGAGAAANPGDTVDIYYTGTFVNGKKFDVASKDQPRSFVAGYNSTIAGLEACFRLFPAGTRATVIIPSALAFGEQGYEGIRPYTPLVYDMDIVRIRRLTGKRPNETGAAMPAFALTNVTNDVIIQKEDLTQTKNIFILFNTGCDHCQQQVEGVGKQFQAFTGCNIYLVSQESKEAIDAFMQQYGKGLLDKKNVTVTQDTDRRFMATFQAVTYPSVYIYNAQHRLVRYFAGQTATPDIIHVVRGH
jgi:FKBP-type peptidyl-prolyl cis-trans isomerase FkpA